MAQLLANEAFQGKNLPVNISQTLKRAITDDELNKFYIIVPTGKIKRELEREILFSYYKEQNKPLSKQNVFTLQEFAKYCFDILLPNKEYRLISEAYLLALFEDAVSLADLKFFTGPKKNISYSLLERLAELISGLKEDGITPENLKTNLENNGNELLFTDEARLQDIYNLYCAYEKIQEGKYLDNIDIINLATEQLNQGIDSTKLFPDAKLILFESFSEFKLPELNFLKTFANSSVPVLINIEYDDRQGPLYTILEKSIESLTKCGFNDLNAEEKNTFPMLNHLKHNLFSYSINRNKKFSKSIKIIEASSRIDEVILIVRLVKYLILEKNINPSDICIALRQPQQYSPLFRETFYSHKIPANIMERFELSNSQVVVGIISILNLIVNKFRRQDIITFLKNPFITIDTKNGRPINADNIISLTTDLRIIGGERRGGIDGIIKFLQTTEKIYQQRLEEYENNHNADYFEIRKARDYYQRTKLALEDFQTIKLLFQYKSNDKLSPSEFRDFIIKDIVGKLHFVQNIKNGINPDELKKSQKSYIEKNYIIEEKEKNIKALKSINDVLSEMSFILEDRHSGSKYNFSTLADRFKTAIQGKKYQIQEKIGYGVTVTTIEQTRRIPFRVMLLPGAIDGEFPTPYQPERFLGMELPESETRHILSERMLFFQFISNASEMLESGEKQIYISYPKFSEERELVRSPFVDALLKVTTLEEDNCIIDHSIIKSAMISNNWEAKALNLIDSYPWLYSIASDIDVHSEFARRTLTSNNSDEEMFSGITPLVKRNIQQYIKFTANNDGKSVKLDKASLSKEILSMLEDKANSPISISQLETYAACPYRYFLQNILKITPPDDLELGMTPLEEGNFLHKIVYLFYTELAQQTLKQSPDLRLDKNSSKDLPPVIPVNLDPQKRKEYQSLLSDIAESVLNETKFDHPLYEIEKQAILGTKNHSSIINIWLNNELQRKEHNWDTSPILFEFGFGSKTLNNSKSETIDLDGLKLKGKVDRVEKLNNTDEFLIADYKLSAKINANTKRVEQGKSFQMPLYMLAMQEIFKEKYGLKWGATGSIYYFFKTKFDEDKNITINYKPLLVPKESPVAKFISIAKNESLKSKKDLDKILQTNLQKAKEIVAFIGNGQFNIEPDNDACTYCKFKSICRINNFTD